MHRHISNSAPAQTRVPHAPEIGASSHWLTRKEAAAHLRLSLKQFDRERANGKYQPSGQSSARRPLWLASDLDAEIGLRNVQHGDPIMALIDVE